MVLLSVQTQICNSSHSLNYFAFKLLPVDPVVLCLSSDFITATVSRLVVTTMGASTLTIGNDIPSAIYVLSPHAF